jgi:hypothetical protein
MKLFKPWTRLAVIALALLAFFLLAAPQCQHPPCIDNSDCSAKDFCQKADGNCEGWGLCETRPLICNQLYAPVCACDDQTYVNVCYANAAGSSVLAQGACDEVLCPDQECGPALMIPIWQCPNGTWGGPTGRCLRQSDGSCGWEIRQCPGQ